MTPVEALDYASVFVFALTGALVASRAQLDIVGFVFVSCLTAVGGGTLRDVVLDREVVFWVARHSYIYTATPAAIFVFFTAHFLESRYNTIRWLDAAALAVAVPAGAGVAIALGHPPSIVVLMGVSTGCFGGLMRDVVCNEVPLVLKQGELYVTCAFSGAVAGLFVLWITDQTGLALLVTGAMTFLLREGSLAFGWQLPVYKSRPPRV